MKKSIPIFLAPLLFLTSFLPFLATPLTPQKAYAKENCIYYAYDDQGNIRFITDELGNKVRSTEYDPFGNWRAAVGQANIHMLYQGQQQDPESNLYYLRARYYDPLIGRFISKDPVKGSLVSPQSQNLYAYTLNNPINLSDPAGEFPWLYALDAAGTALDAASLANDLSNCNWGGAAASAVGLAIPFVSVGGIKLVGQAANVVSDAKKFTPDQAALVDLAKDAQRTGVSNENADTLLQWADEYGLPNRGPEVHPNRPFGKDPHIHIGPVDHIFIK